MRDAECSACAQTQRARDNFPYSGLVFPPDLIHALALVKSCAARVNADLGLLDESLSEAIGKAAREVVDGKMNDQFVVDVFQTGSGTSSNMNANEVIANRATEILGGDRGSRLVHPNDDVNAGQSSNDVIPAAIYVAAAASLREDLVPALRRLGDEPGA